MEGGPLKSALQWKGFLSVSVAFFSGPDLLAGNGDQPGTTGFIADKHSNSSKIHML